MAGERDRFALLANRWLQNEELTNADRDFVIQYLLRNKTTVVINSLPDVLEWSFTGENVIFNTTQTIFQPGILSVDYGFEDLITFDSLTTGPGGNRQTNCLKVSGTTLYVGGDFAAIDGVTASCIAQIDLTTGIVSAMGSGFTDGVLDIDVDSNGNVYAVGLFSEYNYFAKWNGSSWSSVGTGLNNTTRAIEIKNDIAYVAGAFTTANGGAAEKIAKYDIALNSWSALGSGLSGGVSPAGRCLAIDASGNVYAGGTFTSPSSYIAKWNGSSWEGLGSGVDNSVFDIEVTDGGLVYACGSFHNIVSGAAANHVAYWNPVTSTWNTMSSGLDSTAYSLSTTSNNEVYVGGQFESPGFNYTKWTGSAFASLNDTISDDGTSTCSNTGMDIDSSENLYITGYTRNSGNSVVYYIKKYISPSSVYSVDLLGYIAEDENFKSTDDQMGSDSDILYTSQSAVRDYAPKKKVTTTDPTVNDDVSLDYRPSDLWINTNG